MLHDWDYDVGHWLKDVPYVWTNAEKWQDCSRVYILPNVHVILGVMSQERDGYAYGKIWKMEDPCSNFFKFAESISDTAGVIANIIDRKRLRINGISRVNYINPLEEKNVYSASDIISMLYIVDNITCNNRFCEMNSNPFKITSQDILVGYPKEIKHVVLPDIYRTPLRGKPVELEFDEDDSYNATNLWFGFLREKNKDICLPVYGLTNYINVLHDENKFWINPKYIKRYKLINNKCLSLERIRYIIVPVGFVNEVSKKGHANLMIIDKIQHKIYFIDPHGRYFEEGYAKAYRMVVNQIFDGKIDSYEMIDVDMICPYLGFQSAEHEDKKRPKDRGGFCDVWIAFLVDLIINNPGVDMGKLVQSAMSNIQSRHGDFYRFSRSYMKYIEDNTKDLVALTKDERQNYILREYMKYISSLGITEDEEYQSHIEDNIDINVTTAKNNIDVNVTKTKGNKRKSNKRK